MTLPSPDTQGTLEKITDALSWFFAGMVVVALLARFIRRIWRRRHGLVKVGYPDGRFIEVTPGTSVLEASRIAGIPHASVCGGRGRCSTCRVRVRGGIHSSIRPRRRAAVLRAHRRTPNVRLACQTAAARRGRGHPFAATDGASPRQPARVGLLQGSEQEIAILFADIRGFTTLPITACPTTWCSC